MIVPQSRQETLIVGTGDTGAFHAVCRPRGAVLRDLTDPDSVRWVQWFTAIPGVLGIVGLVLHWTVYRGAWELLIRPVGTPDVPWRYRLHGSRNHCEERLRNFAVWMESGSDADAFFHKH
ncbi:hypothetical protein ACLM5J_03005 [Nocardioides sp. Bht2]|uniref:hypothetical protein n=1 Tax=Nocardioides sp. Bht2 TaxID=3392297 RepID=UPI0039B64329